MFLALLRRENSIRHWGEPDVHVKPDLMARMTSEHRSATRLRHVAYKQSRPAIKGTRVGGKTFEKAQQPRVAPIAISGDSHHLPFGESA
jgi:hypothetical protein